MTFALNPITVFEASLKFKAEQNFLHYKAFTRRTYKGLFFIRNIRINRTAAYNRVARARTLSRQRVGKIQSCHRSLDFETLTSD